MRHGITDLRFTSGTEGFASTFQVTKTSGSSKIVA
jgi:hypothetical protein